MKQRIRAAAILVQQDSILLVKHVHPITKAEWWIPPGGGVEPSDTSVLACAERETFEETGLLIRAEPKLLFVREFYDIEADTLNIELFFQATVVEGALTTRNIVGKGIDEYLIKEVCWVPFSDMSSIQVFPIELQQCTILQQTLYLGRYSG